MRWIETQLLILVAVALSVGSISLGLTLSGTIGPYEPVGLAIYLATLGGAHLAQILAGRRSDQVLLPVVGMLGGLSLLLMQRLPQDLVTLDIGETTLGLGNVQLVWLVLAVVVATTLGIVVRSDTWLRSYKYTWAALGIGLLLLTFVFGADVGGQRLTLRIGPIGGQPSELLKVILVVFLAGYLSENRPLLIEQDTRLGPVRLPPLPYLAPMVAMWAIALGIVVVQRDLGAALLFFAVFLALVYAATGRVSLVIIGLLMFLAGSAIMASLFEHVQARVAIWIDPFADPLGDGYQIVQSLHAFARGGLLGMGFGNGLPEVGGRLPIPEVHTDFPLAALGEELGLIGVVAILGLYLVIVERGLRIGASAADDFRSILATGLALVVGVQAFIIAAGNLKVLPLTGVTLPFISYGGSSLLANAVVVGLLLALSDKGVEPPPPPSGGGWRWRLRRGSR
ncbi:MAG: FtsW/RodA/SpoVE family cell cycle protein [Chloroflexota bacterium]|nr:FtsW/RodA/SpoVE family cell cycle protein [Chloroflexota bacterium]